MDLNNDVGELFNDNIKELKKSCDYTISFAGNPNVGKSSIFNALTGLHQHTGNWPRKNCFKCFSVLAHIMKKNCC